MYLTQLQPINYFCFFIWPAYARFTSDTSVPVTSLLVTLSSSKRMLWSPLTCMTKVYPGSDNIVLVVHVKTSTGTYTRPVSDSLSSSISTLMYLFVIACVLFIMFICFHLAFLVSWFEHPIGLARRTFMFHLSLLIMLLLLDFACTSTESFCDE